MSKIVNLGNGFVQVDDFVIEKDTLGIIDKIRDYDPNLDVLYLNPDRAEMFDAPWVIIERCRDNEWRKVFDIWEMNESVFERIVAADTERSAVLASIDSHNTNLRQVELRRYEEKRNEATDKFAHLLRSPKTTYTLPASDGTILTVDDQFGVIKRDGK